MDHCYQTKRYEQWTPAEFLQSLGAKEVTTQMKETGWWIGRYDKEEQLYKTEVEAVS